MAADDFLGPDQLLTMTPNPPPPAGPWAAGFTYGQRHAPPPRAVGPMRSGRPAPPRLDSRSDWRGRCVARRPSFESSPSAWSATASRSGRRWPGSWAELRLLRAALTATKPRRMRRSTGLKITRQATAAPRRPRSPRERRAPALWRGGEVQLNRLAAGARA